MPLLRSGVPLFLARLNPFSFWQKEVPASKSEWDANDASQRVVSPCSCLLCCFSVSVRPLPPAQSLLGPVSDPGGLSTACAM